MRFHWAEVIRKIDKLLSLLADIETRQNTANTAQKQTHCA
jgi:hypothetical protein